MAGYNYSPALADSSIVWNESTISELFAIGPHRLTPGSKMPLQQIPDDADRAELVRFLVRMAGRHGAD